MCQELNIEGSKSETLMNGDWWINIQLPHLMGIILTYFQHGSSEDHQEDGATVVPRNSQLTNIFIALYFTTSLLQFPQTIVVFGGHLPREITCI